MNLIKRNILKWN